MKQLSDLEICKRIAEIEGLEVREYMGSFVLSSDHHEAVNDSYRDAYTFDIADHHYSPLTDEALCFKLSKKYRVGIDYLSDWQRTGCAKEVLVRLEIASGIYALSTVDFCKGDESLNKAICLAIIEAHKES